MGGGIPQQAIATSVVVLVYSSICLTLSTLMACLLWSFGERFTYVMIFASFTAVSTLASIVQQIHYAVDWRIIKQAQFDQALRTLDHPGLAFGGAAQKADVVLFYIQFFCYNVMSLNILFWAVALFIGSWNIRHNNFGMLSDRVGHISKAFTIIFPITTVGLMQVAPIVDNVPAFFIISNFTMLFSMLVGTILLILTLYKYVTTRRLVMGSGNRGDWWVSRGSKERHAPDMSTQNTMESAETSNTRRSIYDRALITRFTIGFVILLFFEAAIIIFNLFQRGNNAKLAASGQPNLDPSGAIVDVVFFIPGVTASLVAFAIFGTTKSWRQYRDLVIGGCGIRNKIKQRRAQREALTTPDQSLEFQRLPSLTRHLSEEERTRKIEVEDRVRMYTRASTDANDHAPSIHTARPSTRSGDSVAAERVKNFHRPFPSVNISEFSTTSRSIHFGFDDAEYSYSTHPAEDIADLERQRRSPQGIFVERRFVVEHLPLQ